MKAKINTSKGPYTYEVVHFTLGEKRINREIAKNNLLEFRSCFENVGITFGLIYGTLLGAIREKNFIEHDEDVDVFVLDEDRNRVLEILFDLRKVGLEVGRYEERHDLLSFHKKGEYIDIYFFKKNIFGKREANGAFVEAKYLENLKKIDFLGERFAVPEQSEELLEKIYGHDWRIPRVDVKGTNFGVYLTIRNYIKKNFSALFEVISWVKTKSRL
jgi:phosphorylcholine metabolism protein LicD